MNVPGKVKLPVTITDAPTFHFSFVVRNMNRSAILGHDFLSSTRSAINYNSSALHIHNKKIHSEQDMQIASILFIKSNSLLFPHSLNITLLKLKGQSYFTPDKAYMIQSFETKFLSVSAGD